MNVLEEIGIAARSPRGAAVSEFCFPQTKVAGCGLGACQEVSLASIAIYGMTLQPSLLEEVVGKASGSSIVSG